MFQTRSVLRWSWQRHAPKSRLLNFKGTLKTGTWDEKSREIPCPSKLKESEISNFNSSKHATLNCNYYCDCRWKTVFKTGVTSAEAPSRRCSWRPPRPSPPAAACRSPRSRWMLQHAAECHLSTAKVGGTTRGGSPRLLSFRANISYLISSDQHSHCPLFTLVHGYPRRVPLQMSKTRMNSKITCFNKMCCVDRDRDMPQNHGSWISGELWRREPEMRNPGKSHAHRSWKNLKFQILSHQNMPHWTAIIIVIAGEKLLSKRLWHRLRPPAVVVLDVHRGLRRQQLLGALHAAVVCCIDAAECHLSSAEVGGTTRGGSAAALSSRADAAPDVHGRALRQEKGDDRRVVVGCCPVQRGLAAARPPDLEESVEAAPVAAQVAPHRRQVAARAATAMFRSRRGEKCSRNEVPQFLWSLCFIFSKSKSATYGNYIE